MVSILEKFKEIMKLFHFVQNIWKIKTIDNIPLKFYTNAHRVCKCTVCSRQNFMFV